MQDIRVDETLPVDLKPLIGLMDFHPPHNAQNEVEELPELHVWTHRPGGDGIDGSIMIVHVDDDGSEPEDQPEVIAPNGDGPAWLVGDAFEVPLCRLTLRV